VEHGLTWVRWLARTMTLPGTTSLQGTAMTELVTVEPERHDHSAIVFRPAAVIAAQTTPPSRVMLGSNLASPSSTRSLSWS
jgi:hypothetical protein